MLYNLEQIADYKEKIKKNIIIMIISFAISLLILVLLAIITNDENENVTKYISMFIFIIIGWLELYILIENVLTNNNKIKVLKSIDKAKKNVYVGEVSKIDKEITISLYEKAKLINFKMDRNTITFYWPINIGKCPLLIDKKYEITLANNIIIDYKELD